MAYLSSVNQYSAKSQRLRSHRRTVTWSAPCRNQEPLTAGFGTTSVKQLDSYGALFHAKVDLKSPLETCVGNEWRRSVDGAVWEDRARGYEPQARKQQVNCNKLRDDAGTIARQPFTLQ